MSRLEDLLQTLCPNGVECVDLGDYASVNKGEQLNLTRMTDDAPYPVFNGGIKPSGNFEEFNTEANTIAISQGGASAGYVNFVETKFWAGAHCYVVKPKKTTVDNKFLYYFIKNSETEIQNAKYGAGIPGLNKSTLERLKLPLPPLPVQEEIVRILDTFTNTVAELEKNLEAEQAARVRQYEHYRDVLLMFDDRVIFKKLGEAGSFFGGLSGKTKTDFQNGNCKFITYMNVYKNPAVDTDINDYVKINPDERQNIVQFGDVLFTGSSETPEECGISSVMTIKPIEPYYLNSFTIGFRLHSPGLLTPDFSKHLFRSSVLRKQINKTANGVTRFNVSKAKLAEVIIPLPPLEVQEQIVSILDRFEILVNDLKSGLPAEIALRRKQYEYYRDKLLTFQPLK